MRPKQLPHIIIQISSPDASKQGTLIMLELADGDEAIRVAQTLAQETGRRVTVRDAKLALIETIPAVRIH
jgi:Tfp pilus assembly protein PilP